nr:hypothetical protein [uncultured Allomuricauda sp.]
MAVTAIVSEILAYLDNSPSAFDKALELNAVEIEKPMSAQLRGSR